MGLDLAPNLSKLRSAPCGQAPVIMPELFTTLPCSIETSQTNIGTLLIALIAETRFAGKDGINS